MFELEQQILQCWQITDDLANIAKRSTKGPYLGINKNLTTIKDYYDFRFNNLFETLEAAIKENHKPVGE
jgi:hypothetical protein